MLHILLVFLGGGLGASCRHLVGVVTLRQFGPLFPFGTITVNVLGSLAMGLLIGWFVKKGSTSNEIRLLLATGFLGGFTTFSAFSLDAVTLWERGASFALLVYILGSVLVSIAAVFAGLYFMRNNFGG